MTLRVLIFSLLGFIFSTDISLAQRINSQADSTAWIMSVDAGLFPAANRVGVGWYPSYSVRAGVGRGDSDFTGFVFVDYYLFKLSEPGGLHSYLEQNATRYDIAVYPAIRIYRILFLGAGFYNTRSDHVTITSIHGVDPWSGGDIKGFRLFCTIGITWDIHLSNNITVPIGIYCRNPGYYADNVLLAFRAGVDVRFR
jgi:hypothetical protein